MSCDKPQSQDKMLERAQLLKLLTDYSHLIESLHKCASELVASATTTQEVLDTVVLVESITHSIQFLQQEIDNVTQEEASPRR